MEYQMRNWYYFTWLSGDHIVEQACHNMDKARWLLKDEVPISAMGHGGRQQRTDPKFGHIFDHFAIVYEFANGVKVFHFCRQQDKCVGSTIDHLIGSEGSAELMAHEIQGPKNWTWPEKHDFSAMYQNEHDELFAAIRKGAILNDGENAAKSSMMAIMGRMVAYTGRSLTWEQAVNSKENLLPEKLEWGNIAMPAIAVPGVTKFV
jgi:predicted dehydrogenase